MLKHTFILEEGLWQTKGVYFDENGAKFALSGQTSIKHEPGLWVELAEMHLRIKGKEPIEIKNEYKITPFEKDGHHTTWIADHPMLGRLTGRMAINDDALVSTFISEDKKFSGSEFFIKFTDSYYLNKGFTFGGQKKLSSWTLDFRR